jgi:class 3 adenylate cyclase/CHASE2 domain-containing sensor protein
MNFGSDVDWKDKSIYRACRVVGAAALIWLVVSYLDISTHMLGYLEQKSYGDRLEIDGLLHQNLVSRAEQEVEVISISDDTYRWASRGHTTATLIPRILYASLINDLKADGAKVIALDMLFDTRQPGDRQLALSIRKAGNVVLACGDKGEAQASILYPESLLRAPGCKIGHTRAPVSVDRPAIDDIEPVIQDDSRPIPALSVEAVRVFRGIEAGGIIRHGRGWTIENMPIVTDYDDENPAFKIRYLYGTNGSFPEIPMETVVGASMNERAFFRRSDIFRHKIVLVGDTTRIKGDRHLTPLDTMPGVIIQANAITTLLSGRFIREAPPWAESLIVLLLVSLTAFLSSVMRLKLAAPLIVLILPAYAFLNTWIFVRDNRDFHLVAACLAIAITATTVLLDRAMTEETEKAAARHLLQRYVNPRIAGHLLKHPELIGAAGRREYGSVLFADIRGFTKMSDALTPEELVRRMNEYFQAVTDIIFRHDGTAASLVGDGLLAAFGLPVAVTDHADQAVAAAIEIQAAVSKIAAGWGESAADGLVSGIGINTGEVIVGEIGSQHLRSLTVYGLEVNIASRVEALNREMGTRILITRSTFESLKKPVEVGESIFVNLKGIAAPVEVYEIFTTLREESTRPVQD